MSVEEKKDVQLMKECINDARAIVLEKRLMESQSSIVEIAIALFNNRKNETSK